MEFKPRVIELHPIVWLRRYVQSSFVIATLAIVATGTNEGFFAYWLVTSTVLGALFLALQIVKGGRVPFKVEFPFTWLSVTILTAPNLVLSGMTVSATYIVMQSLMELYIWHNSKDKQPLEVWKEKHSRDIQELVKHIVEEHKNERTKDVNGKNVEHLHDMTIMFEMSMTVGKMISLMEEEGANKFIKSFKNSTELERWTYTICKKFGKRWQSGEVEPKRKRHAMRALMEHEVLERIKSATTDEKEKQHE